MIPRREMGNVWIKWIIETLCTGKSIYRSQKRNVFTTTMGHNLDCIAIRNFMQQSDKAQQRAFLHHRQDLSS